MDRLTIPDELIEGGMRRSVVDARAVKEQAMGIYWRLKAYEDTGLEPEEIAALKKDYEKSTCTGCWLKDEKNIAKIIAELKGLLESAVEELENIYQGESELTERIREVI